jgi:hypothetical protein
MIVTAVTRKNESKKTRAIRGSSGHHSGLQDERRKASADPIGERARRPAPSRLDAHSMKQESVCGDAFN